MTLDPSAGLHGAAGAGHDHPTRPTQTASPESRAASEPHAEYRRWRRFRQPAPPSDLVRLAALRVVLEAGPLPGLQILNLVAPVVRRLGEVPPTFPLLHQLGEDGLLVAFGDLPRQYTITAAGTREARRLADAIGPLASERLEGVDRRIEALLGLAH